MAESFAPWTTEQVDGLHRWQSCEWVHPFTCSGCTPSRTLHPTPRGWTCALCGHQQDWAHDFMLAGPPPNPMQTIFGGRPPTHEEVRRDG